MITVKVSHIEVVQAIQNAVNEAYNEPTICEDNVTTGGVPIVTDKATYARVYFEDFNPPNRIRATGTLEVEYTGSGGQQTEAIPSEGFVGRNQGASPALINQRLDWNLSLNFRLPDKMTAVPEIKNFRLVSLTDTITGQPITIDDADESPNHVSSVKFLAREELTCRALVFRYRDVKNDVYLEPTREEVNIIRNYVERSFPVARIEWSVIRVEAQRDFFALDPATHNEREHDETATRMLSKLLHQIMAHRNQELKAGFSTTTYYIGVYSDPRARFGSVAVDAPTFPLPHIVAACATDTTGEIGAHEVGHLLGRAHPGVPLREIHGRDIGQYRIDKFALTYMGKHGFLSPPDKITEEEIFIGLDIDPSKSSPTVLAPKKTFDLMSYRYPRWPSAYTYRELYKRLACTGAEDDFTCKPKKHWTVVCSFDINRKEGQILSVLPTNYLTPEKPDSYANLEQFIVQRAIDQLGSQIEWLVANDQSNPEFWASFQKLFDDLKPKCLQDKNGSHDPAGKKEPIDLTVSVYNSLMNQLIDSLVDEPDFPRTRVVFLLDSNNIAIELYEPDIRIYANYPGDDDGDNDDNDVVEVEERDEAGEEEADEDQGDDEDGNDDDDDDADSDDDGDGDGDDSNFPDCPEENIDYMWNNAIRVYYRRIGSRDRFPFGLLQATVPAKPESKKPPLSLTLMIDKIVVDKYAQSFKKKSKAKKVARAIFKVTDCVFAGDCAGMNLLPVGNGGDCEDRPPSNSLVYDIRKGAYYLNFHWPMAVLRRQPSHEKAATIITTVQCLRRSKCIDSDVVDDKWETVCVTGELRAQVWISPDLFDIEYDPPCPAERPSAKKPIRSVGARRQDELTFRFLITVGYFEFVSDEYSASPVLVIPRRYDRFEPADSNDQCPDDFQYDDGTASLIDDYTPA